MRDLVWIKEEIQFYTLLTRLLFIAFTELDTGLYLEPLWWKTHTKKWGQGYLTCSWIRSVPKRQQCNVSLAMNGFVLKTF